MASLYPASGGGGGGGTSDCTGNNNFNVTTTCPTYNIDTGANFVDGGAGPPLIDPNPPFASKPYAEPRLLAPSEMEKVPSFDAAHWLNPCSRFLSSTGSTPSINRTTIGDYYTVPESIFQPDGGTRTPFSKTFLKPVDPDGEFAAKYDKSSDYAVCTGVKGVPWNVFSDFHHMWDDLGFTYDRDNTGKRTTFNIDLQGNTTYVNKGDGGAASSIDNKCWKGSTNDDHTAVNQDITINIHDRILMDKSGRDSFKYLQSDIWMLNKKWGAPCMSESAWKVLSCPDDCDPNDPQVCNQCQGSAIFKAQQEKAGACSPGGCTKPTCWDHGGVVEGNVYASSDLVTVAPYFKYDGAGDGSYQLKEERGDQFVMRLRIVGDNLSGIDPAAPEGGGKNHVPRLQVGFVNPFPDPSRSGAPNIVNGSNSSSCATLCQPFANMQCVLYDNTGGPSQFTNYQNAYNYGAKFQDGPNPPPKQGEEGWGETENIMYARTGAAIALKRMLGPGRFSVVARARPTGGDGGMNHLKGRGYVLAIWTFAYTEIYGTANVPNALQWTNQKDSNGKCRTFKPTYNANAWASARSNFSHPESWSDIHPDKQSFTGKYWNGGTRDDGEWVGYKYQQCWAYVPCSNCRTCDKGITCACVQRPGAKCPHNSCGAARVQADFCTGLTWRSQLCDKSSNAKTFNKDNRCTKEMFERDDCLGLTSGGGDDSVCLGACSSTKGETPSFLGNKWGSFWGRPFWERREGVLRVLHQSEKVL